MSKRKTILVADDSSTVRKFICFNLRMKNFDIVTAKDGLDALQQISHRPVDLAIIDAQMPNMDGFELIKTMRNSLEYKDLPIIILGSGPSEESIQHGAERGADSYMVKPFNAQMIQSQIARFLGSSE